MLTFNPGLPSGLLSLLTQCLGRAQATNLKQKWPGIPWEKLPKPKIFLPHKLGPGAVVSGVITPSMWGNNPRETHLCSGHL